MKQRIFLIDNNLSIIELITIILEDDGYEVILGQKPFSMSHLILKNPSVIILHNGRDHAGTRICKEIKDDPLTNTIPVILSSTQNNLAYIATICKADAYLNRPFDIVDLSNLIKQMIN